MEKVKPNLITNQPNRKGETGMSGRKIIAESPCFKFCQNSESGNIEISLKNACNPEKTDSDIREKLQEMEQLMDEKGGRLRLVFETEEDN